MKKIKIKTILLIVLLVFFTNYKYSFKCRTYNNKFSLKHLMSDIFVPDLYASIPWGVCKLAGCYSGDILCATIEDGSITIFCMDHYNQ